MKQNLIIKRAASIIFLLLTFAVLCFFYSLCIRPQKDISEEENRTLDKVPAFSLSSFISSDYQDKMESSISDQMLFSIEIKYAVKQFYNYLTKKFSDLDSIDSFTRVQNQISAGVKKSQETSGTSDNSSGISNNASDISDNSSGISNNSTGKNTTGISNKLQNENNAGNLNLTEGLNSEINAESENLRNKTQNAKTSLEAQIEQPDKNSYVYKEVVAGKIYRLDDSGYIFSKAFPPEDYCFELYEPEMIAAVTFPKYLLFIQTPESADFNDLKKYNTFEYIKKQFPMTGYDTLSYNSFAEYKTLFYQTDHHWNYRGSYEGYKKIMRMLEGDDVELLKPQATHVYNTVYNGSLARDNLLRCATEKFTVYEYKLPPYKTYINDEEKVYGYRDYYVSDDDFPHKTYTNHYGMYYGDDWAKVVYDFNQSDKENLLILGTSYTNAINELIASHYNKTHVLDFRHYKKQYGERINAEKYMEENNISKLILLGDISSLGFKIKKQEVK